MRWKILSLAILRTKSSVYTHKYFLSINSFLNVVFSQSLALKAELEHTRQLLKKQTLALEEEKKKCKQLKAASKDLSEKYEKQQNNFRALKMQLKPIVKLAEDTIKRYTKATRAFFQTARRVLECRDPKYIKKDNKGIPKSQEKINFNLPYHFVLQEYFDIQSEVEKKQNEKTSTFLFANLDGDEERFNDMSLVKQGVSVSKNVYCYKLLLHWNVVYDGEELENLVFYKIRMLIFFLSLSD